ncbi:molybdopterin molybdotransferase MoeA [Microbacterium halophytorum]|uniref:molybdopterin molybdotransferase MoeA n=1 Tax=Microbacterium halophytorum TaxID=2067568 RepID=UPI000CFC95CB|nr:gephyrin-like molybdotransferase Glp [Microbacterium halophytorum]
MNFRSIAEHRERVLSEAVRTPVETVPLALAAGRTLAERVEARVAIPVFDNSAMDGFAVRFADVAGAGPDALVRLRVVADVPAGSGDDPAIRPGEAARIMTGAIVPADADAIVPFEDTRGGLDDSLRWADVTRAPKAAGAHIRRRGEDKEPGDQIVPAGARLGAFELSAAAAAGVDAVAVARRPRVLVLSTGSELARPGAELGRGRIPESNSVLLSQLAHEADAELAAVSTVADDPSAFLRALADHTGVDAVITSGGVSAGAYEVVKNALGGSIEFAKVAMQPGKPQGFGRLPSGAVLFALPGNPVSAAVSFEAFVRPALLAMQGRTRIDRDAIRLTAAAGWRTPPGRTQFLPAAIDRRDPAAWTVSPATARGSGSHIAGGLAAAEAFAVVPAGVEEVRAGDAVDVLLRC